MTAGDVVGLLQNYGGYGVAALLWYFWREERKERVRYRDLHENVLTSLPQLTEAIERLTEEVKAPASLAVKVLPELQRMMDEQRGRK
jgi:hypothetical protein